MRWAGGESKSLSDADRWPTVLRVRALGTFGDSLAGCIWREIASEVYHFPIFLERD